MAFLAAPACGEPSADGKITTLQHKNKAGAQYSNDTGNKKEGTTPE